MLPSCIREQITRTEAYFYNNTEHNVFILFYHNGRVAATDSIHLTPNSSYLFEQGSRRGNFVGRGFASDIPTQAEDSVIVVFDSNYKVSHYINPPNSYAEKYYDYSSTRNISNVESYEFIREKGKKGVYTNIHNYYFTEADYEYAKD